MIDLMKGQILTDSKLQPASGKSTLMIQENIKRLDGRHGSVPDILFYNIEMKPSSDRIKKIVQI